jgi:hypothetical protein
MGNNTPCWFGLTPAEIEEERRNRFAEEAYDEEGAGGPAPPENVGHTDLF